MCIFSTKLARLMITGIPSLPGRMLTAQEAATHVISVLQFLG